MKCIVIASVFLASMSFGQGDLTPPGVPQASMKTLGQIEPRIDVTRLSGDADAHYVISEPGSYYLTGDLEVTNNYGIKIVSPQVTLDLNGFCISTDTNSHVGVYIWNTSNGAVVRNGTVRGFAEGIAFRTASPYPEGCLYENLLAAECGLHGMRLGPSSRAHNCRAVNNGGNGIVASGGCVLTDCIAGGNRRDWAIFAGEGSSLHGCVAYDNAANAGISTGSGCVISRCTARENKGHGSYSYGIYADGNCTIVKCAAISNTNTNSTPLETEGVGIFAGSRSTVEGCTVSWNQGDGIVVDYGSTVRGCTAAYNGRESGLGAAIRVKHNNNRIEGNNVLESDFGIRVDLSGNFIVRNTASNNSADYSIAAGNDVGTIQTSPVGAGAWDNFEF